MYTYKKEWLILNSLFNWMATVKILIALTYNFKFFPLYIYVFIEFICKYYNMYINRTQIWKK